MFARHIKYCDLMKILMFQTPILIILGSQLITEKKSRKKKNANQPIKFIAHKSKSILTE